MLDTLIAKYGSIFLIILALVGGACVFEMLSKWYLVHNQAQGIANGVAKVGGYTTQLDNSLKSFAEDIKATPATLDVTLKPGNKNITFGTVVYCNITYIHRYQIGDIINIDVPIKGRGRAICSAFNQESYGVAFTTPSY